MRCKKKVLIAICKGRNNSLFTFYSFSVTFTKISNCIGVRNQIVMLECKHALYIKKKSSNDFIVFKIIGNEKSFVVQQQVPGP